jgi:hypothetical protein
MLDLLFAVDSIDRNPARFHRLGDFAHELDFQEPAFKGCSFDLDVLRQIEHSPERTC